MSTTLKVSTSASPDTVMTSTARDAAEWRMTTMRWLSEKYPEYCSMSSSKPALERLKSALGTMSRYDAAESAWRAGYLPGPAPEKKPKQMREEAVTAWSAASHAELVLWLAQGGYTAEFDLYKQLYDRRTTTAERADDDLTLELEPDESTTPEELLAAAAMGVVVAANGGGVGPGTRSGQPTGVQNAASSATTANPGRVIEQDMDDVIDVAGNDFAGSW